MKITKKELANQTLFLLDMLYENFKINLKMPIKTGKLTTSKPELLAIWKNVYIDEMMHVILINTKQCNDYAELNDCIVHEIIHAFQYELGLDVEHNEFFCYWVVKLGKLGYNISCNDIKLNDLQLAIERAKNED